MFVKYIFFIVSLFFFGTLTVSAQNEEEKTGFQKDRLFTGGSLSLGFSGNSFQVGGSPFFGYSLASWVDAGITVNANYTSFRNVYTGSSNDKLRRTNYGVGPFTRLYPVRFIFIQAQYEKNFITQKYIPGNGDPSTRAKATAASMLVGAGYTTDRYPFSGRPFFYLSVLFDILNSDYSPYANSSGNIAPIIRAGIQVPLFQGRKEDFIPR